MALAKIRHSRYDSNTREELWHSRCDAFHEALTRGSMQCNDRARSDHVDQQTERSRGLIMRISGASTRDVLCFIRWASLNFCESIYVWHYFNLAIKNKMISFNRRCICPALSKVSKDQIKHELEQAESSKINASLSFRVKTAPNVDSIFLVRESYTIHLKWIAWQTWRVEGTHR